jgi:hypothetical protein
MWARVCVGRGFARPGRTAAQQKEEQAGHSPVSTQELLNRNKLKYNYGRTLPHTQKDNRPLFVTFSTKRWVLPESSLQHLIFTPLISPAKETYSLPDIVRLIKGRAARNARKLNLLLRRHGPVWQEECFDHVLRSNESLAEKVEYICQNPVRAGLVQSENDYPWLWRGRIPVLQLSVWGRGRAPSPPERKKCRSKN